MSEWRGPKQCPKCGAIDDNDPYDSSLLYHKAHCRVDMIPYERRKDDALAAMTRERDEAKESAIRSAEDAVALLGMKDKAERERDALREIVAQVGDWIPFSSKRNPRRRGCTCLSCRARAALKEGESK